MNDLGLERWHDFYLIVGGASAGLTGLMFVVVTLAPRIVATTTLGVRSFDTPTVVFFTTSTIISAVMAIPIVTVHAVACVIIALGALGLVYMFVIGAHRVMSRHELAPEDWAWYLILPILAYAALVVGGALMWSHPQSALLLIGLTALIFMVIGVRNAWDLVLYMAQKTRDSAAK